MSSDPFLNAIEEAGRSGLFVNNFWQSREGGWFVNVLVPGDHIDSGRGQGSGATPLDALRDAIRKSKANQERFKIDPPEQPAAPSSASVFD